MNKHQVGRIYMYAVAIGDGQKFMEWPKGLDGAVSFTHDLANARFYATKEVAAGVADMLRYSSGCDYNVVCVEVTEVSTTTIKIVEDAEYENV